MSPPMGVVLNFLNVQQMESTSSFSVPEKAVKQREQFTYPIGGVPVQFPCKPYPTQLQMMSKVWLENGRLYCKDPIISR